MASTAGCRRPDDRDAPAPEHGRAEHPQHRGEGSDLAGAARRPPSGCTAGHTDSQGGTSYNQELSQRRAQAVRDYLVSRGIAADRVTAQGVGPSRAITDNKSAEGRANNRRVEIVVEPKTPHTM